MAPLIMLVLNRTIKTYPAIRMRQAEHQKASGVKKTLRARAGLFYRVDDGTVG